MFDADITQQGSAPRVVATDVGIQESAPSLSPASYSIAKRIVDVVVASALILLLAAPMMLIAIIIRLDSPGEAIFRQTRTGLGGRPFTVLKFRTMVSRHSDSRAAVRDDARITRIGAFLRQNSIDELPQLFNVLRGEMSLVGPRPHDIMHDLVYAQHLPNYNERFLVRPGLTGLAQIENLRGSDDLDAIRLRLDRDLEYVRLWSPALDFRIMSLTLPHLLMTKNAY